MLRLNNIKKDYRVADLTVHALKNVTVNFRKSEFVSVLGPSGCGKTTLLNIIGGLDRYTDGDLVIRDKSTKEYKSRDWDSYRNQTVGFVFQSYNLIPHLNVLQNVELALTISGVGRSKKKAMATAALERVGLGEQLKKKPMQMSGGQMQRVAIARAIVNNPDIILADEPTGALDSKTSEQVMDILQEISDDKLIIMVTHNPELAARYSTRIIELSDGEVVSDSNPYDGLPTILGPVTPIEDPEKLAQDALEIPQQLSRQAARKAKNKAAAEKRAAEKKLAVNRQDSDDDTFGESTTDNGDISGKYVAMVSPDTPEKVKKRSGQPKEKKQRTSMSFFTALSLSGRNLITKKTRTGLTAFAGSIGIIGIALVLSLSNGFNIYMADMERSTLASMPITISSVGLKINIDEALTLPSTENEFPDVDFVTPYEPNEAINGVKVSANILTSEYIDYIKKINPELLSSIQYLHSMNLNLLGSDEDGTVRKLSNKVLNWQELLWENFMTSQYDVVAGGYPGSPEAAQIQKSADDKFDTYNESGIRARQAVLVISSFNTIETSILEELGYSVKRNPENNTYYPIEFNDIVGRQIKVVHNDDYYVKDAETGLYTVNVDENSYWDSERNIDVTVVGVLRIKEGIMVPFLSRGLAYTEDLTNLALDNASKSQIALDQKANTKKNVISGKDFSTDLSPILSMFSSYGISESEVVKLFVTAIKAYFEGDEYAELRNELDHCEYLQDIVDLIEKNVPGGTALLKLLLPKLIGEKLNIDPRVIETLLNSAYTAALQKIGAIDMPTGIYIYPKSFESKKEVLAYLDAWNIDKKSTETVEYTDLASSVSEIITRTVGIVSYILIAFAAISLVVSSVMIGIITYISVIERTTEIGVLRSIGARKVDIMNVFNAETFIIGLSSGIIGVLLAWLIDFPLNAWIHSLMAEAPAHFAQLNPLHALILIALSVILTMISGLIPASMASRKDPVTALRSNG